MTNDIDGKYESKPRKESGNILCKSVILLCLGIFVIWILLTLYNFLIFMTHLPLPPLDPFTIFIFILGFIVGWFVREKTKD
jgi:hypothetical protein